MPISISSEMSLKGFISSNTAKSRTMIGGLQASTFFGPAKAEGVLVDPVLGAESLEGIACGLLKAGDTLMPETDEGVEIGALLCERLEWLEGRSATGGTMSCFTSGAVRGAIKALLGTV